MVSQTISYLGTLRCSVIHGPSGVQFVTDAPTDNHGRGQSFSPTDLVVTALATCIVTTMGIRAQGDGVSLDGSTVFIEKHMSTDPPRRISRIALRIEIAAGISASYRLILEHTARTCPVAQSIHPGIESELSFHYDKT
ncbi:MAG: OsmC family protein [Proteobacteria bacterium]|nr:OsmC family protein [Pseudomonadota bacterium]